MSFQISVENVYSYFIPGQSLIEAYKQWRAWADPKVCCDYAFHMAVTCWNKDVAAELPLVTQPDIGINSFKVFMAYKDVMMLQDDEIIEVFKVSMIDIQKNIYPLTHRLSRRLAGLARSTRRTGT